MKRNLVLVTLLIGVVLLSLALSCNLPEDGVTDNGGSGADFDESLYYSKTEIDSMLTSFYTKTETDDLVSSDFETGPTDTQTSTAETWTNKTSGWIVPSDASYMLVRITKNGDGNTSQDDISITISTDLTVTTNNTYYCRQDAYQDSETLLMLIPVIGNSTVYGWYNEPSSINRVNDIIFTPLLWIK